MTGLFTVAKAAAARSRALVLAVLLACAAAAAGAEPARHPALAALDDIPLISLEDFFVSSDAKWGFEVSPDGRRLLWQEARGYSHDLMVEELATGAARKVATSTRARRHRWAPDSRHVYFLADTEGDENTHVYVRDTRRAAAPARDLTPGDMVRVHAVSRPYRGVDRLLIQMERGRRGAFGLYSVDLASGEAMLLSRGVGIATAPDAQVRLRVRRYPDGGWMIERREDAGMPWQTLVLGGLEDRLYFKEPVLRRTGYALSNRDRDRMAVVRLDLATGAEEVLHADPVADVAGLWLHPLTGQPLMAWSAPDYWRYHFFDRELEQALAAVRPDTPHLLRLTLSDDLGVGVVGVGLPEAGYRTWLLDRDRGNVRLLAESAIAAHRDYLAPMRPIAFAARDGLALRGYLTRLPALEGLAGPCVLRVHGGPWSRDVWSGDTVNQFLANRGYGVLQVNYRGSLGFGRRFAEAGERQFGRGMFTDVLDGLDWAIGAGVCDPQAVAIMGMSFGGYQSLLGATLVPERFAGVIDIMGPVDLAAMVRDFQGHWGLSQPRFRKYFGDRGNEADRRELDALSPINLLDRIQVPVLVIQGANDVRVRRAHSDRLVAALRERGKPVRYVLLEGVGHSFGDARSQMRIARAIEAYLVERLGGRSG